MEPLIVLVGGTLLLRTVGAARVPALRGWPVALRGGLAAMFAMTGLAHFDVPPGMRGELVGMVPDGLSAPETLVDVTGVLELAGAAGLLSRRTSRWSAAGLAALLIAMFPANVHKALVDPTPRFDDQLGPRSLLQLVFLAATIGVLRDAPRQKTRANA